MQDDLELPTPESLYARHYVSLVRAAALMIDDRGQAEEVVQDAFAQLFARWSAIDPDRAVSYLYRSVTNGSHSALRRRRTIRAVPHDVPEPVPGADAPVLRAAGYETLLDAVRRLPPRQREVLVLRYFSELSVSDTAVALNTTPAAVATATRHALIALRQVREELS